MRVVSLLPSATEIAYALGLEDELVGVTFECDEPERARRDKAVVVGGRDTTTMSPREIDDYVREQAATGGDLYTLHEQALAALQPDVVLTQDLCRVCALPADRVADALTYLGCDAEVVTLDPRTLSDVLETITTIGASTGAQARAEALVEHLQRRLEEVRTAVAGSPRPRTAIVEWIDPPFSAGHWVPDLITAAGGEPVGAASGARSTETTWHEIAALQPDLVVMAPCGFGLEVAVAQTHAIRQHLPDVPVWAIDANGLVVRPGPRLVDGVEALAWVLHPSLVPPPPAGRVICVAPPA